MSLISRRGTLAVTVAIATLMLVTALTDSGRSQATERGTAKSEVVCLNYHAEAFFYGVRPRTCDYYDARAPENPLTALAMVITRKVHWSHWGHSTAIGKGQWHPKGAGYWTPGKVKLSRPVNACGHRIFSSVQVKVKFPGESWPKSWGRRTPIKRCTD